MARTLYVAPIPPLNTVANTQANYTTAVDISPAPQIVLPANILDVGQVLRLTAFGVFSTTLTPTLQTGFYYGGATGGTALATTAAVATASGVTNVPWRLEYEGRVRSTGTAGTIMGHGYELRGTSVSAVGITPIPTTALANVTIDTTTAKTITVGAGWGSASASNTITCHHFGVELIG